MTGHLSYMAIGVNKYNHSDIIIECGFLENRSIKLYLNNRLSCQCHLQVLRVRLYCLSVSLDVIR